jgi:hypothetical protein
MKMTNETESPVRQEGADDKQERWSGVLNEVHDEMQTDKPWYVQVGIFCAWAAGIAVVAAIVAMLILGIVDLFSAGRVFTARSASDWLFWTAALLLFAGLLAPSATEFGQSAANRQSDRPNAPSATQRADGSQQAAPAEGEQTKSSDERRRDALRKRMLRVYNPWRWRLWVSALVEFALSVLTGLLV